MTADILRLLAGIALVPACWASVCALCDCIMAAGGGGDLLSPGSLALIGGIAAFALCWAALPHMTRTYVFGHELTHALWGLLFGAVPSDVRVGARGGSVRLTKTNFLITLAPYFFPFYTFVVLAAALAVRLAAGRLPFLPLWMFGVGFTWAFHVLFTLETLGERQPDVAAYGRVFSWTFIFIANVAVVALCLAATTPVGFDGTWRAFSSRAVAAYRGVWSSVRACLEDA